MGKADTITKKFIGNPRIFADIFNQFVYGGEQRIRPEELRELDTTMITVPYGADGAKTPVQKHRDAVKILAAKCDGNVAYCILGAEPHTNIHYAIPVKNGMYDFIQLSEQVEAAAKSHKAAREKTRSSEGNGEETAYKFADYKPTGDEYLSGFWKTDKLLPVVTVTVYFGADEWDGPLSLSEMYSVADSKLMKYVPEYHVNLIDPFQMTEEQIDEFKTEMKQVMLYVKYSKDKDKLYSLSDDKRFTKVQREAVDVINAVTKSELKYSEDEEEIDVCQAVKELRAEGKILGAIETYYEDGKQDGFVMNKIKLRYGLSDKEASDYMKLVKSAVQ